MKKFYALIFLAAVVLSLASCNAKKDTDNSVYDSFISGKVTAAGADNKKLKYRIFLPIKPQSTLCLI